MKKIFSLLLVVTMIASLSLIASADAANVASYEVVETNDGIVVTYYITNPANVSGFTAAIVYPSGLTINTSNYTLGTDFAASTVTPGSKTGQVKFAGTFGTATDKYVTKSGKVEVISFSFTRGVANDTVYTSSNFTLGSGLYVSKISLGDGTELKNAGTSSANSISSPANFVAPVYTDNRTSADEFVNDTTSAVAKDPENSSVNVITCAGRVGAEYLSQRYGVEFTAESTVGGNRPQVFYGAKPGDTVSDGAGGTTTFVFDGWDGTFEIVLKGVHTGTKSFRFFVGSTYTDLDSKVVSE